MDLGDRRVVRPGRVVGVKGVRIVERPPVDHDPLVLDRDGLSGQPDDALQECAPRVLGVTEDEQVTAPHRTLRQEAGERARAGREDELVHEEAVAGEDVLLHRRSRNREGLEEERTRVEREDDRREDGAGEAARARLRRGVHPPRYFTTRNIRSHRVREKKCTATPASWRIFATGPRQMWEFGSAS